MKLDIPNLGWLEVWWFTWLAESRAELYWMFHPFSCQIYTEYRWDEIRGQRNIYGEPMYRMVITYVAVVTKEPTPRVIRDYYGMPREPIDE